MGTKTRPEIELPLQSDQADDWNRLLEALGFQQAATVHKFRRTGQCVFRNRLMTVVLDHLPVLEPNAYFTEIETMADEADLEAAKNDVFAFVEDLGLDRTLAIRTSYLSMTLDAVQE